MADSPSELQAEIQKLEQRHAENPEGRYFVPLANAYRKRGDLARAEDLLRAGLRSHPDYLSAHIVLGRCLADRGAAGEAADEFRYVLSMDPQNLIALRSLGELAQAEGNAGEAAKWYRELLAVDPMNEEARRALDALEAPAVETPPAELQAGSGWWQPEEEPAREVEIPSGLETGWEAPAPEPEIPTATGAEPSASPESPFGQFIDLDTAPLEPEAEEEEDDLGPVELVTETIAELYARQGLHDRAAEVYRELIRRRGGDEGLERKLAEVEARAAGGEAARPREPDFPSPEPVAQPAEPLEPAEDAFAASFESGFAHEVQEAEPIREAAVPVAAPAGPTIREYLLELAAWRPDASEGSEPLPSLERPGEKGLGGGTAAPLAPEPRPQARTESDAEPEPEGEPDPWSGPGSTSDPEPWSEPQLPEPPPPGGTEDAGDEPFPWELPGEASAGATGATPEAGPAPEPTAPAEERIELQDYFGERTPEAPSPGATAEPAAAPEPTDAPASPEESDDDLESFQAWLRSLKR